MSSLQIENAFPEDLSRRLDELYRETGDSLFVELSEHFELLVAASRSARAATHDKASSSEQSSSEHRAKSAAGHTEETIQTEDVGTDVEAPNTAESAPHKAVIEAFRDRLSTRLMEAYRTTGSSDAFGLLYEINYRLFLNVISSRLRKFYFSLDAQDVLQEVFFNIYRYPHKFHADKDRAFRHWASMIIRNTVYKCARERDKEICHELQDEEIEARADRRAGTPLGEAIREESRDFCSRAYLIFLRLYLAAYQQLSTREKKALHMVEVEGHPYKVTAKELGIRLENLKMVIFRARKKILRMLDHAMASAKSWRPAAQRSESRDRDRLRLPSQKSPASARLRSCQPQLDPDRTRARPGARLPAAPSRRDPRAGLREAGRSSEEGA